MPTWEVGDCLCCSLSAWIGSSDVGRGVSAPIASALGTVWAELFPVSGVPSPLSLRVWEQGGLVASPKALKRVAHTLRLLAPALFGCLPAFPAGVFSFQLPQLQLSSQPLRLSTRGSLASCMRFTACSLPWRGGSSHAVGSCVQPLLSTSPLPMPFFTSGV